MATIIIHHLSTTGSELFSDSESYLDQILDNDTPNIYGGYIKTPPVYYTAPMPTPPVYYTAPMPTPPVLLP